MKRILFSAALLSSNLVFAAEPVDGWYTGLFGGYTYFTSELNRHLFGSHLNVNYDNGFNAGARIGFQSNPIRYELEYTYLRATPERLRAPTIGRIHVDGYTHLNAVMANLYYDFPDLLPEVSPFLGVGIGYTFTQSRIRYDDPYIGFSIGDNDHAFTYQATAGLTYNFAENWAINAAYRYLGTADSGNFNRNLQAHMGNVGIVYRFDCWNYK